MRWEVQTWVGAWENIWSDGDGGEPVTFATHEEARQAREEHLASSEDAHRAGYLSEAVRADHVRVARGAGRGRTCPACGSAGPFEGNGRLARDCDATVLCLAPVVPEETSWARMGMTAPDDAPQVCGEQFHPRGWW